MRKKSKKTPRATCLNCMDGRVQLPVITWIRKKHKVAYVDVITEAGMDGVLAVQKDIAEIRRSIAISVNTNGSTKIFVVGHHDCRGNPVGERTHRGHIKKAVKRIKKHWPNLEVVGLWVDSRWRVSVCCV